MTLNLSLDTFRRSRWRMRLIALCLLCFTVQNALASGHFHFTEAQGAAAHVTADLVKSDLVKSDLAKASPAKRVVTGDNASCPLCQFLILGSAALHQAVAAAFAPVESVSFVVANQTFARLVTAISYSWQGRGPPLI